MAEPNPESNNNQPMIEEEEPKVITSSQQQQMVQETSNLEDNNHHKSSEKEPAEMIQEKENEMKVSTEGVEAKIEEEVTPGDVKEEGGSSDEKEDLEPKLDESLFNLPEELLKEEQKLQTRMRETRWGERQIKRSKIQEDAVFNPLEALYSGNSLMPITQYGQAELEIKMQLYSDGKRRKSKWHNDIEKTFVPPHLNYISPNLSYDEIEYILRLYRLDELTSIISDYTPDDPDVRSPSPEPIYDRDGKRINTREVRKRDQFHRERISLIEDCMKMRPESFKPPDDYKPLKKFKKIYLTESAANDSKANYIGKIIGPEGATQKIIEKRSGCKIAVRGKGANKKQKDIFENFEPLHIIIVADNDESLEKGVDEVQKRLNGEEDEEIKLILEGLNTTLQGIFKDNYCENCEMEGHRTWACPFGAEKEKVKIICSICGETSHPTSDCPEKQAYLKTQQTNQIAMLLESQYNQFKDDLEEKPKGGMAFITDIDRKKLLAIGDGGMGAMATNGNGSGSNIQSGATGAMKQSVIEEENLPVFEDD